MSRGPQYLSTPSSFRSHNGYGTPMALRSPGTPEPNNLAPTNDDGASAVIWGTTVNVRSCMDMFSLFLHDFTLEDQFEPFYEKELHRMHRTQEWVLNVNVRHLFSYRSSAKLAKQLIEYPHEVIPLMDNVANNEYMQMFGEGDIGANKIQVCMLMRPLAMTKGINWCAKNEGCADCDDDDDDDNYHCSYSVRCGRTTWAKFSGCDLSTQLISIN